ncbi:MarR family winged helix-turn-helix transcriptional regulator [Streptomyces tubercidicus]|uniref:MarR family winged helix-turn-helix transcriptional regulator n=1 Tax=Streptomyces tubercidicus TaxID=47759 RepID=UPI003681B5B8
MSRFTSRSPSREQASAAALAATELLEVLWGRGQEAARSAGVSPSQLRALLVIEKREGTNLRTLAEALASRPPAVSRLCDRLEAMGLAERGPSATSRREVQLRLSLRGKVLLDEYRAARSREVTATLEQMQPADVAKLAAGLEAFHAAFARHAADQGGASVRDDSVADSA